MRNSLKPLPVQAAVYDNPQVANAVNPSAFGYHHGKHMLDISESHVKHISDASLPDAKKSKEDAENKTTETHSREFDDDGSMSSEESRRV